MQSPGPNCFLYLLLLFNCSVISSWISLSCVIYLPGCRKWTLWLTKDWRMPFSQTSGARSAWRDSAPSVTCWSVMAFYHQHICVLYRGNAQTYADPSLMRSLLSACTLSVVSLLSYLPHKRFHIYMKEDVNVGCKWAVFYLGKWWFCRFPVCNRPICFQHVRAHAVASALTCLALGSVGAVSHKLWISCWVEKAGQMSPRMLFYFWIMSSSVLMGAR